MFDLIINKIMENIENFYQIMNLSFFVITLILEVYVIGWRLRFKMDMAAYFILITQLLVMASRIFLSQNSTFFQPMLVVIAWFIVESTLYFFVFEMKQIWIKIVSETYE